MPTTATLVRPLTARSVVLSLLLGTHPPRLPVRDILDAGELFGISPATMRVALTRLVQAGDLVADQAVYALSPRHLERHRLQELRARSRCGCRGTARGRPSSSRPPAATPPAGPNCDDASPRAAW